MNKRKNLKLRSEIQRHAYTTLDYFRILGQDQEVKNIPEKLKAKGVFKVPAFTEFLVSLYKAASFLGPEMVSRRMDFQKNNARYLNEERFKDLVLSSLFSTSITVPLNKEDVEVVMSFMEDPAVCSFLFEFADTIITKEIAMSFAREKTSSS